MNDRETACCFSGHRPRKLIWGDDEDDARCIALKKHLFKISEDVYLEGMRHFICGMALGCDMYFCEAVIRLKDKYDDITLEAAIPCEEQAKRWSEEKKNRYSELLKKSDIETFVQRSYSPDCMIKRNRYMVENSSLLIAVYDGTVGGTMKTVEYALRCGLRIIEINPLG
jgi:uncharacterized phage-like protein YoqJ